MRILIFLLCAASPLLGQNYITNGSFERTNPNLKASVHTPLPAFQFAGSPEVFNAALEAWHTYKLVTPDILRYDSASAAGVPLPVPHKGGHMLGLIMYLPGTDGSHEYDYHEYVGGKLGKSLSPGKTYEFSFWVHEAKAAGVWHLTQVSGKTTKVEALNCGNFGCYFSTEPSNPSEDIRRSIFQFNMEPQLVFHEVVTTPDGWRKMSAVFVPDRPFRYFIFGNFKSDGVTPTDMPDERHRHLDAFNGRQNNVVDRIKRIAYYCFDDFSLTETTPKIAVPSPNASAVEQQLITTKTYTFSATLLFDTDEFHLKAGATKELDELVLALRNQPLMRLEIGGHTDNTGTAAHNLVLSQRRAGAVKYYLLQQGIAHERLQIKGYSDQQPIGDNTNAEGRSQNRRVECKVL